MSTLTTIETPERSAFTYEVAGLGSRTLAYLADVFVQGVAALLLMVVATLMNVMIDVFSSLAIIIMLVGIFLIFWGYPTLFETFWRGQTPGKWLLGIRVIREGGATAGFLELAIRNLLRIIDMLPAAYVVGIITIFLTPRHQRVGDLLAGTLVVRAEKGTRTVELSALLEVHNSKSASSSDRLGISPAQAEAIATFAKRYNQLLPKARADLAQRLAAPVRQQLAARPALAARLQPHLLADATLLYRMLELYHNPSLLDFGGGFRSDAPGAGAVNGDAAPPTAEGPRP